MSAADIARRLGGRKSGGSFVARCPAHADENPSLSIREVNGKVLVHCHAGCSQDSVLRELDERGLWREAPPSSGRRRIVAEYDYRDESGRLLYQVVRTEPKSFFQRQPDGQGGWINRKAPRQILYRLAEVLEAPIVFVVEGERDVETLRDYGFVATTNSDGAKAPWLDSYTKVLAGREVILVPDKDHAGRQRVLTVARALLLGHAHRIVIWEPEDPRAKDITDWFLLGHSELELIARVEDRTVSQ
jgi:DNA primase